MSFSSLICLFLKPKSNIFCFSQLLCFKCTTFFDYQKEELSYLSRVRFWTCWLANLISSSILIGLFKQTSTCWNIINGLHPANISTLFQRCLLVDTSWRGTTLNQRSNNVVYFNVGIYNVNQCRVNVVYFNVDMKNVRQRRNNAVIFNENDHL